MNKKSIIFLILEILTFIGFAIFAFFAPYDVLMKNFLAFSIIVLLDFIRKG